MHTNLGWKLVTSGKKCKGVEILMANQESVTACSEVCRANMTSMFTYNHGNEECKCQVETYEFGKCLEQDSAGMNLYKLAGTIYRKIPNISLPPNIRPLITNTNVPPNISPPRNKVKSKFQVQFLNLSKTGIYVNSNTVESL